MNSSVDSKVLNVSDVIALVGAGRHPEYPTSHVYLWYVKSRRLREIACQASIKSVTQRCNRLVVVLDHSTDVYDTSEGSINNSHSHYEDQPPLLLRSYKTSSNPKGLVCVSKGNGVDCIACLGEVKGSILVETADGKTQITLNAFKKTGVAAMALSIDGSLLAATSEKGTSVCVFSTSSGDRLRELRRGSSTASVYSLSFNHTMKYVALSSDKLTVHVFLVVNDLHSGHNDNDAEGGMTATSTKSLAQIRDIKSPSLCSFDNRANKLHVLAAGGGYRSYDFEEQEMTGVLTVYPSKSSSSY